MSCSDSSGRMLYTACNAEYIEKEHGDMMEHVVNGLRHRIYIESESVERRWSMLYTACN